MWFITGDLGGSLLGIGCPRKIFLSVALEPGRGGVVGTSPNRR